MMAWKLLYFQNHLNQGGYPMPNIDRRSFLTNMAAAGTVASISGTSGDTLNKLIPYVIPPENIRPGTWVNIATTCRECPAGCGMHVRHRDSRIIKCEGNAYHSINKGGLCPRGQSAPQGLYNQDRIKTPYYNQKNQQLKVSWDNALSEIAKTISEKNSTIAVISDLQTGTLSHVINTFLASFGSSKILLYEPFNYEPLRSAHSNLFGIPQIPRYNLTDCDFLLSFGADFLETWVSPVEFAHQFSTFRSLDRLKNGSGTYMYFGPRLSMTAANADHFFQITPESLVLIPLAILQAMVDLNLVKNDASMISQILSQSGIRNAIDNSKLDSGLINNIAQTISASSGALALSSPVAARSSTDAIAGTSAVSLLNYATGSTDKFIDFSHVHAFGQTATEEQTQTFLEQISSSDVVFIHTTNIAFTRPDSVHHLKRAKKIVYLNTIPDETAQISDIVLPVNSPLESWGDYEPYTGVHSIMQPTMSRVVDSRTSGDIFMALTKNASEKKPTFHSILIERWRGIYEKKGSSEGFNVFWNTTLRKGYYIESIPAVKPVLKPAATLQLKPAHSIQNNKVQLWVWPSIMLYDGRLANRGWMQESPEPVSYTVWSSWVDIHHETAETLGIKSGENVVVSNDNGTLQLPARITDETAPGSISIMIGQGHSASELQIAKGIGVNPFEIVIHNDTSFFGFANVSSSGNHGNLAYTSPTRNQYHRDIVRSISLSELRNNSFKIDEITYPLPEGYKPERDLYQGHPHRKHRWAMVVDLHKCIGCGACGVACYAENNIPVMGKKQVENGREMAWLKIVPYFLENKKRSLTWLPMLCQHCDAAPCEPVCPVYASFHNEEGLNAQIYNRCVGTRYCSNNCPYKVRRFNWFDTKWVAPLDTQLNPEVTVRCRGVMEKCTFCVQRIRYAEYQALREHRPVRDGEVQPACVQSCPTRVYTFGDLLDPDSMVTKIVQCEPRKYQVLWELNTKPAVMYLKKVVMD
jgi:molybdopterin-containing oxidoreductase family iron-sulfur binding subunit